MAYVRKQRQQQQQQKIPLEEVISAIAYLEDLQTKIRRVAIGKCVAAAATVAAAIAMVIAAIAEPHVMIFGNGIVLASIGGVWWGYRLRGFFGLVQRERAMRNFLGASVNELSVSFEESDVKTPYNESTRIHELATVANGVVVEGERLEGGLTGLVYMWSRAIWKIMPQ